MFTWIILSALALLGGGALAYRMGRRHAHGALAKPTPRPEVGGRPEVALLGRGLSDMRPGDIIERLGRDWLIESVVNYEEAGHRWSAARIIDRDDIVWLLVGLDRGPQLSLRWLAADAALTMTGYPPKAISHPEGKPDCRTYRLSRRGTATVKVKGDAHDLPAASSLASGGSLRCRWWLYQAAGQHCLLIEQWGETYRALVGESVTADSVELLAAS